MNTTTRYRFIKFLFLLLAVISLYTLTPEPVFADGSFLCSPSEGADSQIDVTRCVNNIYRFGIIAASIGAVFLIILAGYFYMFSGGDEHRVSKAKDLIKSSLLGIAILLTGLLILRQINPDLLQLKSISPEQVASQEWVLPDGQIVISTTKPAGATSLNSSGRQGSLPPGGKCLASACPTIATIVDLKTKGIACKNYCGVLPEGANKLAALKAYTDKAGGPTWRVTEAYPPSSHHSSPCHYNGRCVDINPLDKTAANYDKMCVALKAVSASFLNEAATTQSCGTGRTTTFGTGAHLHVVLY